MLINKNSLSYLLIYIFKLDIMLLPYIFFLNIKLFLLKEFFFYEDRNYLGKGFANQITVFRRTIFHLMHSGIDGSRFYIYGPYSGHIGMYSENCSIKSFFTYSDPNKIQKRFTTKGNVSEYMKTFKFVKKLNFMNTAAFLNQSFFEENTIFIPFTYDNIRTFNRSNQQNPKNYLLEFLENDNITEKILLPCLAKGSYITKLRFSDFFNFNEYLFEISNLIIHSNLKSKRYLALHARLGDFKRYCLPKKKCFIEKTKYLQVIDYLNQKSKLKVFVISNEYFNTSSNLLNLNESFLEQFLIENKFSRFKCFMNNMKYTKMFVEMIITCNSSEFYYNEFSSLSRQIILLCQYIGTSPKITSIQKLLINF